jgi:hypothetical protein
LKSWLTLAATPTLVSALAVSAAVYAWPFVSAETPAWALALKALASAVSWPLVTPRRPA